MSIYEYVSERGQERNWERQFVLDLVKEVYGPMHDEVVRNLARLKSDFGRFKWDAATFLRAKYLGLLIPAPIVAVAERLTRDTTEYNLNLDRNLGNLQTIVSQTLAELVKSIGGEAPSSLTTGAEARYILGATSPGLKEGYDRFLEELRKYLAEKAPPVSVSEVVEMLRDKVLAAPEARALLDLRARIEKSSDELLNLVRPRIRSPYEF